MSVHALLQHIDQRGVSLVDSHDIGECIDNSGLDLASELYAQEATGFLAFGRALLVRPLVPVQSPVRTVEQWHHHGLWKREYDDETLLPLVFFAEDAFGWQYAEDRGRFIVQFDPEIGEITERWDSFEAWCSAVTQNPETYAASSIAQRWEAVYGTIRDGQRLTTRQPLCLGGVLALEEVVAVEELDLMRFRGSVARQIRDVPDGGQVQIQVNW